MSVGRRNRHSKGDSASAAVEFCVCGGLGMCLTWDGVGESVGVFGYESVLNVSSADSVGSCQTQTQSGLVKLHC